MSQFSDFRRETLIQLKYRNTRLKTVQEIFERCSSNFKFFLSHVLDNIALSNEKSLQEQKKQLLAHHDALMSRNRELEQRISTSPSRDFDETMKKLQEELNSGYKARAEEAKHILTLNQRLKELEDQKIFSDLEFARLTKELEEERENIKRLQSLQEEREMTVRILKDELLQLQVFQDQLV
eukprot:TRINITY_DN8524_c0_g1_i11.p1 TRINITY_DN8524_c0_g1~~TRINITY_DN8524_c0_g1_i11.p1  ORF type:complete len:181 (+),score=45.65 TRINITY_DN8524_c0_g1_i11:86-628(+)